MVESIKNLTKNIDISKNNSTSSSKIDKLILLVFHNNQLLIQLILVAHYQLQL